MENKKYMEQIEMIQVPVKVYRSEEGVVVITTLDDKDNLLNQFICSQGDTYEKALSGFWKQLKFISSYDQKRSHDLNKYKFFSKGDWSHIGGTWFTILGIQFYFRIGKNMKGGWFVPFTKINICISNYWKSSKVK